MTPPATDRKVADVAARVQDARQLLARAARARAAAAHPPAPNATRLTRPARRAGEEAPHVSRGMDVAAAWAWRAVVVLIALAAVFYILRFFSELLIPLLVSILLCAMLVPLVDALDRRRVPRVVAVIGVLLLTAAVIAGLITLVSTQVATGFSQLSAQTVAGIGTIQTWLKDGPLDLSNAQLNDYITEAQAWLTEHTQDFVNGAVAVGGTAGKLLSGAFLVFFSTIFLLFDGRRVWSWVVHLLPVAAVDPMDAAARRGWVTLVAYVRATVIVAFVDALGIGIGAVVLGLPLAIPLGVLVFLAAFVPIVGALVSGAVAVLVALVYVGLTKAIVMLVVVLLVQQIESHILQPFLLGRAVSVHPLAVVLGIVGGTTVAGIAGAVFAVPVIAVLNTVIGYLVRGDTDATPGLPGDQQALLAPDPAPAKEQAPAPADELPVGAGPLDEPSRSR